MCGIVAVLLYPRPRSIEVWQDLGAVFTRALVSNEERGQAATGLAVVQADGQAQVYKQPIRASQFVETPSYRELMATVGPTTTLILGHTRLPTQGSAGNPDNNHPIEVGPVLGVHNGHIANDAELFERWRLPRRAEVESEIIFQMLAAFSPQSLNGTYLPKVSECLAQMEGQFTFVALDRRCPAHLLVLKHANPLCLHYQSEWQALFFCSRYLFLRQAFGRSVITEALPHDQLLYFDACRLPELTSHPCAVWQWV
ncbi:MAG TPA: hypothetical protein VMP08_23025 [Anaerolineae bacterium]|nr:hypothetical protein [Anaerolineae bacterium]